MGFRRHWQLSHLPYICLIFGFLNSNFPADWFYSSVSVLIAASSSSLPVCDAAVLSCVGHARCCQSRQTQSVCDS